MNIGAGPVTVRTQVFTPDGQQVADGGEVVLAAGAQAGPGLSQLSGVFKAGKLSAGQYTLSVVVTDQASNQHTSSTTIRVL